MFTTGLTLALGGTAGLYALRALDSYMESYAEAGLSAVAAIGLAMVTIRVAQGKLRQ